MRFVLAAGVRQPDVPVFLACYMELHKLIQQRLDRLLAPENLQVENEFSLRVALKHGLKVHNAARKRRAAGDASAALEEVQVVYHDVGADLMASALCVRGNFLHARAVLAQLHRLAQDHALAGDGGERIHHEHLLRGIFLLQYLRRDLARPAGAADAAGHAQIEQVFPRGQMRLKRAQKSCGVDHRSFHHQRALLAHALKKRLAVEHHAGLIANHLFVIQG